MGGERRKLVRRVDLAHLGRLGEAEAGGLGPVHLARAGGGEGGLQRFGPDLAAALLDARDLGAAGHELGRAALVILDVGGAARVDHAPGRREGGDGHGIGRGPGHHREDPHRGLEQVRERGFQALGPGVAAIGRGATARRFGYRVHDLRRGGGDVVAAKVHVCSCLLAAHASSPSRSSPSGRKAALSSLGRQAVVAPALPSATAVISQTMSGSKIIEMSVSEGSAAPLGWE